MSRTFEIIKDLEKQKDQLDPEAVKEQTLQNN